MCNVSKNLATLGLCVCQRASIFWSFSKIIFHYNYVLIYHIIFVTSPTITIKKQSTIQFPLKLISHRYLLTLDFTSFYFVATSVFACFHKTCQRNLTFFRKFQKKNSLTLWICTSDFSFGNITLSRFSVVTFAKKVTAQQSSPNHLCNLRHRYRHKSPSK